MLLQSNLRKDFAIWLVYRIPENVLGQTLECSSVRMDDSNEIEYSRHACETYLMGKEVHCHCRDYGFFFVTQLTKTSNTLKTSAPEGIRLNPCLLLAFIFIRVFALVGILELLIIAV